MITVSDGSVDGGGGVDRIRVRIWHDVDGLIYDDQLDAPDDDEPTTALGGGRIVIQSGKGGGGGGSNR